MGEAAAVAPTNPWWVRLLEAVAVYALESHTEALQVRHFIDWLAEWGREVRRQQTGLLLLSAHRSKGLEFDHVVVLDSGWQRGPAPQASEAERRLNYVAMTRARQTLTLARMKGRQTLVQALTDSSHVFVAPGQCIAGG